MYVCMCIIYIHTHTFSVMLFDAFNGSDNGINIWYRTDSFVFNLRRLQAKTKVKTKIINEFLFTNNCSLNATTKANMQNSVDKFSMACDNFDLTISTKKTEVMHQPVLENQHDHQGTMTEGCRKVHLPWQYPL